jgi:hypothetical protein
MRAIDLKYGWGRAVSATLGVSALVFTFACSGTRDLSTLTAQPAPPSQAGLPVVVSCEPHQRALVRPTVVNGATVSQVECVTAAAVAAHSVPQPAASAPAAYAPVAQAPAAAPAPRSVSRPVEGDLGDARVVPASTGTARTVRTNQVIDDERPVKRTRSVKKSAVIIGSSAGVGAGVGAAMGGKKGALIGAAIGGGGAAIWDQVTRRK